MADPERWKATKCRKCGALGLGRWPFDKNFFPPTCSQGHRHDPVQEIEVQPTEVAAKLVGLGEEMLEAARACAEGQGEHRWERAVEIWDAYVGCICGKEERPVTHPPQQSLPDCGKQSHLWIVALKPGERVTCRRCGKKRRGRKKP